MDRGPALGEQATGEDRHHARLAGRVLAGTVDVGEAQRHRGQAVHLAVEGEVALDRELGDAVRAQRALRRLLVERHRRRLAVDRGAAGEDHLADRVVAAALEQLETLEHVEPRVVGGMVDAPTCIDLRGEMEDGGDRPARQDLVDRRRAGRGDDQLDAGGKARGVAAREIVDHRHRGAPGDERFDQMGADEAGAAGDHCPAHHPFIPPSRGGARAARRPPVARSGAPAVPSAPRPRTSVRPASGSGRWRGSASPPRRR